MNKFRVWDGERMWYPGDEREYYLDQSGGLWYDGGYEAYDPIEAEDAVAMPSLDRKDGNGTEIYVGDLITTAWLEGVHGVPVNVYSIQTLNQVTDSRSAEHLSSLEQWHIIGNVYENPGLLEGE